MADLEERFRRLLVLVPYVMARGGAPVKEVCERFGIRRSELVADLNLLFMCGLPGYGPGDLIEAYIDGGHVWISMADYFSRPMRLTASEGLLLYSGAQALAALGDANPALQSALQKLQQALAPGTLERVNVGVDAPSELSAVKKALQDKRRLRIVYQSHSKDEVTRRDVDPWAVLFSEGHWYLVGWCHRVRDERVFRVDRMREAEVLEAASDPPDDLDLSRYESLYFESAESVPVTIDVSPRAQWVADYYPLVSREELGDGWMRIKLKAGGLAWVERLILRLGPEARIVEPRLLENRVQAAACRIAERYA